MIKSTKSLERLFQRNILPYIIYVYFPNTPSILHCCSTIIYGVPLSTQEPSIFQKHISESHMSKPYSKLDRSTHIIYI